MSGSEGRKALGIKVCRKKKKGKFASFQFFNMSFLRKTHLIFSKKNDAPSLALLV